MITVKIRDVGSPDSIFMGKVPFAELNTLVERLRNEGVNIVGEDTTYEIETQWVVDQRAGESYLEILVENKDE